MIPRLTQSWCGCSLQTGTKIISIFHLVSKLFLVSLLSVACANFRAFYDGPYDDVYKVTFALLVTFLIGSVVRLIASVLLVLAAYTLREKLSLPWLILDMISRVIDICLFIAALVLKDMRFAILSPIRIVVGVYFWLIIFNFRRELREGNFSDDRISAEREEDPLLRNYRN